MNMGMGRVRIETTNAGSPNLAKKRRIVAPARHDPQPRRLPKPSLTAYSDVMPGTGDVPIPGEMKKAAQVAWLMQVNTNYQE